MHFPWFLIRGFCCFQYDFKNISKSYFFETMSRNRPTTWNFQCLTTFRNLSKTLFIVCRRSPEPPFSSLVSAKISDISLFNTSLYFTNPSLFMGKIWAPLLGKTSKTQPSIYKGVGEGKCFSFFLLNSFLLRFTKMN